MSHTRSVSTFTSRLARKLVRRYPLPWRERYEAEVLALFEDSPPGLRDLAELFRALLVERARALIEADDRPGRTETILGLLQPAFVVLFVLMVFSAGYTLREWRTAPQAWIETGAWAWQPAIFAVVFGPWIVWLVRRRHLEPGAPVFPAWVGVAGLPVAFAAMVLAEWTNWGVTGSAGSRPWIQWWLRIYFYGHIATWLSSDFWPGRRLLRAIGHLQGVQERLNMAEMWVTGCHTMIAQGVPSPLAEAQAEVERWTVKRDEAAAEVRALAYRARFADRVRS